MKNKTSVLLYPFYDFLGEEFKAKFNSMINKNIKYNLYINDFLYSKKFDDDIIFIHILESIDNLEDYLLYFESHENFVTSYEMDDTVILVFKLNEPLITALRQFKKSKYSKMYKKEFIEKYFSNTKDWTLMHVNDGRKEIFEVKEDLKNLRLKWDNLNSSNFFNKLLLSPYHVLNKTPHFRKLLEIVYNTDSLEDMELSNKLKLENEILNYKENLL